MRLGLKIKDVNALTLADLKACPVWEFVNEEEEYDETAVRPVRRTPLHNLDGRLVGTRVRLANDAEVWALIGNVDAGNPRATQHFLTLSVFRDGQCFALARYHDADAHERGPQALADFLGLPLDQVFPIAYDLGRFSKGDPAALSGSIEKEPRERLTKDQIIALALKRSPVPPLDWAKEHQRLWSELVPPSGQAPTVQGEVIRCTGKLTDEAYRNGNINWDDSCVRMWRFIEATLDDARTFTADERSRIRDAVKKIIERYDRPDLSGAGSPYYFLSEMAARWCLAHPEPVARQPDPKLDR